MLVMYIGVCATNIQRAGALPCYAYAPARAVGWELTPGQVAKLDAASGRTAPYPYFPYQRQEGFARLNPPVW